MTETTIGDRIKQLRLQNEMTLEQLGNAVGVGKSTVRKWEIGMIANMRRDKIAKIAKALHTTPAYLMGWEATEIDTIPVNKIPILGRISAGLPLYAEEHIEGYTLTDLDGGNEYFALRVQGDSMNAININEGDLLIVRKQDYVDNGGIAVVMVDGEDATVKRFYRESNTVTLMPQSTNPIHAPQIYDIRKTKIKVIGKVLRSQTVFE